MDIKLRNQEFWAKNMFLKLCSPDRAAQEIIGADGAYSQDYPEEQIRISLSAGEGVNDSQHKRKDQLPKESLYGEKVSYLRQKG